MKLHSIFGVSASLCLAIALSSCADEKAAAPSAPPAKVAVIEVKPETIPVVSELPGRIASLVTVQVKPRITGIVLKRVFEQGAAVKEGDILYEIDPEPFEAAVASARAALDSAVAAQTLAQQQADRQTQLVQRNATSQDSADTAIATLGQRNADVEKSRADLQSAELELQYTKIRSPITGTIGRALVTEGALVSPTSDVMAVIQQIDPVYADFTRPAESLIALKNAVADGSLQSDETGNAHLKLLSAGGQLYPHDGKLLFTEVSVNSATGQVILRGEFPNPDTNLLPGMYVRGRLATAARENALAVPEQAIQRDAAGQSQIFIVGAENKVEVRNVTLGWLVDGRWVIIKGLEADQTVIVEGFQRIAPGAVVQPEPWAGIKPASGETQNTDKE